PPRTIREQSDAVPVSAQDRANPGYTDALKAVVWRDRSSRLRLPQRPENALTPRDLATRVDDVYRLNHVLGTIPYPKRGYRARAWHDAMSLQAFGKHVRDVNELPAMQSR